MDSFFEYVFWGFVILSVIAILFAMAEARDGEIKKQTRKEIRNGLTANHNSDYIFYGHNDSEGIAVGGKGQQWVHWRYADDKLVDETLNISDILELNVKIDDEQYHSTGKEGSIGRAVVGGLLFGGAGAVVGAVTAKEKQEVITNIKSLAIEFFVDRFEKPSTTIPFYIYDASDTDEDRVSRLVEKANEDVAFISMLYALSARGLEYGCGLQRESLREAIKVHEIKLKKASSEEDKKALDVELSRHLRNVTYESKQRLD